jgi:hypothetical protein
VRYSFGVRYIEEQYNRSVVICAYCGHVKQPAKTLAREPF